MGAVTVHYKPCLVLMDVFLNHFKPSCSHHGSVLRPPNASPCLRTTDLASTLLSINFSLRFSTTHFHWIKTAMTQTSWWGNDWIDAQSVIFLSAFFLNVCCIKDELVTWTVWTAISVEQQLYKDKKQS